MTCSVFIFNTGNVRLSSLGVTSGTCHPAGLVVLPGSNTTCSVSKQALQVDFETGSLLVPVTATASPFGKNGSQAIANDTKLIALEIVRTLTVTLQRQPSNNSISTTLVSWAGDMVHLLVTAANTGNVHLHNVTLDAPDLGPLTCVSGSYGHTSVALPADTLPVGQHLECSGSFVFTQDALEDGDRIFTTSGMASALANAASATPVVVPVAAMPQFVVDVDGLNCTKPARMREYCSARRAACIHELVGNSNLLAVQQDGCMSHSDPS